MNASVRDLVDDLLHVGVHADVMVEACRLWRTNYNNKRKPTSGELLAEVRPLMKDRAQYLKGLEYIAVATIR